jgi:hypothetical protein
VVSLSGRASAPPAPTIRDGLARQHVVVTLADESGVQGVLWSTDETGLVLAGAAGAPVQYLARGGGEWETVDGAVFVPAGSVKFVQLPGGVL